MSSSRGMIRSIVALGGWTLVSRGAGLVRELMMAAGFSELVQHRDLGGILRVTSGVFLR